MTAAAPWPVELRLRRADRRLEIDFDDGMTFDLSVALLRAMSPSAADRGHRGGSETPLPIDCDGVALLAAEPVGAYAVRLVFDDGHDTGLYTWAALRRFGEEQDRLIAEHRCLLQERR